MPDGLVSIRVQGLGSLADVTLRPGPLTVLIGPNGAGKSNVLRALKLAPLLRAQSLQRVIAEEGGASAWLHYGPKRTPSMRLELRFELSGHPSGYRVELGHAAGDRLVFIREESWDGHVIPLDWDSSNPLGTFESHMLTNREDATHSSIVCRAVECIAKMAFYHFHDTSIHSALRANSRPADDRSLRSDGSNLGSYLARLERGDEPADAIAWRRINQLVHRIAPSVKELRPTVVSNNTVRLDWIDDQDEVFGVHQMSDGTLRAVALITALTQPEKQLPKFICIDEPELGLHPAAMAIIAELARSISRHCQVLFATQSPAFLDHFDPQEVVVVERNGGKTVLRQLDPEALSGWLEDYSLSEVFDKGVIGGCP